VKPKLANLDALKDALGDMEGTIPDQAEQLLRSQSLQTKKGSKKKMDRVVRQETERFSRNLGVLEGLSSGAKKANSWETLRTHIKTGMK
jgi:Ribosome biogenesis protein SLX9